ncbi:MAG: A24 family peptidase [Limisphaerales bacterium]
METIIPTNAADAVIHTAAPVPALLAVALVLTAAVFTELKENKIPNWLTFTGMAAGLAIGYLYGKPALWSSFAGLSIGFGFLFIFYVFGGVGGGDVKLMGAAGALMGSELIKPAVLYTALLGAFLALMLVIWRRDFWLRVGHSLRRLAFWSKPTDQPPAQSQPVTVPYGLAIAAGCLLALIVKG